VSLITFVNWVTTITRRGIQTNIGVSKIQLSWSILNLQTAIPRLTSICPVRPAYFNSNPLFEVCFQLFILIYVIFQQSRLCSCSSVRWNSGWFTCTSPAYISPVKDALLPANSRHLLYCSLYLPMYISQPAWLSISPSTTASDPIKHVLNFFDISFKTPSI